MSEPERDLWVAAKLKAEADRYEPDLDRIRERIRERGAGPATRRAGWLLPAAAAATFVVLAAGGISLVQGRQSTGPQKQAQVAGSAESVTPAPSGPSSTAVSTTKPTGAPVSHAPSPSGSAVGSTDAPTGARTTTGTEIPPRAGLEVQLVTAQPGQAVDLPGNAADWIAAGTGSAGETIRSDSGGQRISGPHETGSATSSSTTGPFALSWTGGLSESSANESRIWRTVKGPAGGPETGLIIRVPADQQEAELVLYLGAGGADAELRTQLGAKGKETKTRLKARNGGGYVATIRFRTAGPAQELTARIIGGSGGSISFAAATLR